MDISTKIIIISKIFDLFFKILLTAGIIKFLMSEQSRTGFYLSYFKIDLSLKSKNKYSCLQN